MVNRLRQGEEARATQEKFIHKGNEKALLPGRAGFQRSPQSGEKGEQQEPLPPVLNAPNVLFNHLLRLLKPYKHP